MTAIICTVVVCITVLVGEYMWIRLQPDEDDQH